MGAISGSNPARTKARVSSFGYRSEYFLNVCLGLLVVVFEKAVDTARVAIPMADERSGENVVFERLVEQHGPLVLRTAWRLLGNREDAQDVAQEAFLRLHRNLSPLS